VHSFTVGTGLTNAGTATDITNQLNAASIASLAKADTALQKNGSVVWTGNQNVDGYGLFNVDNIVSRTNESMSIYTPNGSNSISLNELNGTITFAAQNYFSFGSKPITNAVWNGTAIGSSFITEADPVWGVVSNMYLLTNGNGSALTALPSWAVTNNQPNISGVVMANVTTNLASPTFGGLTLSGNEDVGGNLLTNAQFEARGIPYTVPFATSNDISTLYSLQYYEPTNTTTIYLPAADTNYSYSIRLEVNPGTNSFSIYTNSGVLFTTNDVLGVGSGEVRIPTTMSSVLLLDKPKYNNKWRVWGLQ
jgi:hypothetical protein